MRTLHLQLGKGESSKLVPLATKNTKLYEKLELREFTCGGFHYRIIDPELTVIVFFLYLKKITFSRSLNFHPEALTSNNETFMWNFTPTDKMKLKP